MSSNKTFLYTGPNSAVTLKVINKKDEPPVDVDVLFWNGQHVDLPADHEVTLSMQAQGLLAEVMKESSKTALAKPK
jgi:hypothetical protein